MQIEIDSAADQSILSSLREGKARQAARLLVRYHGNTVFNVCRTLVDDSDQAEDLTQESFRRAFRGLSGIQGTCSPRDWLIGIAQSCCAEAMDNPLPERDSSAYVGGWRISESLQRRLDMLASAL